MTQLRRFEVMGGNLRDPFAASVCNLPSTLTILNLGINNITYVPENCIYRLPSLQFLNLGTNQMSQIPSAVWTLISLTELYLDLNQFTGIVPTSIGNLINLQRLTLNNNSFTGCAPDTTPFVNLTLYDISSNSFTGVPIASVLPPSVVVKYYANNLRAPLPRPYTATDTSGPNPCLPNVTTVTTPTDGTYLKKMTNDDV